MRRLPAWFRVLLLVLPRTFRERHREEILELIRSYEGRRPAVRLAATLWAALDMVLVGLQLRWERLRAHWEEGSMLEGIRQDLSFAQGALRRRPGFTAVAVLTLALGIGGNALIFSVVNGVLLSPLPYASADRIGILWHEFGDGAQNLPAVHPLDVVDYRDRSRLFETFTMAAGREWILGGDTDPELVDVGLVEAGFFEFFGHEPLLGRTFTPEEDVPGMAPVVVLSHRLWERRYGADPEAVGRSIDLDGTRMRVVGVLPPEFRLHLPAEAFRLRDAEVWVSLRLDPADQPPRNYTGFTAFGRLRPDATFAQAQDEIEALEARLEAEHPEHAASKLEARVVPLLDDVVKDTAPTLVVLFWAVGFVLVIACANVANLLIVRSHGRVHEYALRSALGAGRRRLVRLALVEGGLIALAGAVLGGLVAMVGLEAVEAAAGGGVPRLADARIDGTVLLFVASVTVGTALVLGLLPALRSGRVEPAAALVGDARAGGGRDQRRLRDLLIVIEVASSLVLLVGTGLMVRTFSALLSVDPGYATEGALTYRISLPDEGFPDRGSREALLDELLASLGGLPSVEAVAATSQLPLTGAGPLQPFAYDEETATNWESVTADDRDATPGFFDAMGARMVEGRTFTRADARAGRVVIVDDRLAALAYPGESAVGKRLQINPNGTPEAERYATIVGVVSHLRLHDVSRPHLTQIYGPMTSSGRFSVVVRSASDPAALAPAVLRETARLAPGAPVEDMRTLADLVDASLAPDRLALGLMTGFGLVALLLASIGIYGVLSFAVAQRTREIGVRVALGETPAAVRAGVMADGARLVVFATALGLAGAALLSHAASGLLFGVAPLDVPTYVATTGVLLTAAGLACWIPARRATRVDPVEALRC